MIELDEDMDPVTALLVINGAVNRLRGSLFDPVDPDNRDEVIESLESEAEKFGFEWDNTQDAFVREYEGE